MTTPTPINLDKLRNAVQKFGAMSFTTAQIAADYYREEMEVSATSLHNFEDILHRHAALLGLRTLSSPADTHTVWQSLAP